MPKLKVYRTPIKFHDAYIAAPSQKVALKAWGSDGDLFARGIAEVVTEEALSAEPLASPGKVIRKLRGTADEQIVAANMLDQSKARQKSSDKDEPAPKKGTPKNSIAVAPPPPPPRPVAPESMLVKGGRGRKGAAGSRRSRLRKRQ